MDSAIRKIKIQASEYSKLNSETMISHTSIFPPHVKPGVPDYEAKQLPTAYCCKKSSILEDSRRTKQFQITRLDTFTWRIWTLDNQRVQVFNCNG